MKSLIVASFGWLALTTGSTSHHTLHKHEGSPPAVFNSLLHVLNTSGVYQQNLRGLLPFLMLLQNHVSATLFQHLLTAINTALTCAVQFLL